MEDKQKFYLRIKFVPEERVGQYVLEYSHFPEDASYLRLFEYKKEPWESVGRYKLIQGTYQEMEERAKEFTSWEKVKAFQEEQKRLKKECEEQLIMKDKENRPYLVKQII